MKTILHRCKERNVENEVNLKCAIYFSRQKKRELSENV